MTKNKVVKAHRVLGPGRQVWVSKGKTITISFPEHRVAGLHFKHVKDIWDDEWDAVAECMEEVRDE